MPNSAENKRTFTDMCSNVIVAALTLAVVLTLGLLVTAAAKWVL